MVELACVGLTLNPAKTKIVTTYHMADACHIDVGGSSVEVLHGGNAHKYLGRLVPGDLKKRSETELVHRLQVAWAKFHKHKHVLTNRHVSLKLRLRFFDTVISPAILFGLASLPLVASQLHRINIVQRRMLRSIVGWVALDGNDWRTVMRRMNDRLQAALELYPVCAWSDSLFKRQYRFAAHVAGSNSWPGFAALWEPCENWRENFHTIPSRARGRPQQRWDDMLRKFCENIFGESLWFHHARQSVTWFPLEGHFVQFCREQFSL